jgi:hypothetical protein
MNKEDYRMDKPTPKRQVKISYVDRNANNIWMSSPAWEGNRTMFDWWMIAIIGTVLILSVLALKENKRLFVVLAISTLFLTSPAKADTLVDTGSMYPAPVLPESNLRLATINTATYVYDDTHLTITMQVLNPDSCHYQYSYDEIKTNPDKVILQVYTKHMQPDKVCLGVVTHEGYSLVLQGSYQHVRTVSVNGLVAQEK